MCTRYCNYIVFVYFYRKQGGTRWASGKSGPLNSHAQDVLKKKSTKADKAPRKIKILGDEPIQSYKKKATPRAEQTDNIGATGCGQCERVKATLVKYCILFPCPPIFIFVLYHCCFASSSKN